MTSLVIFLAWAPLIPAALTASQAGAPALEPTLHARALVRASRLPRLRSLLVSIKGERVEEQYFNGAGPSDGANLKSVSKSVLSALVGIALDQGYLQNVHDTIGQFFPQYLDPADKPAKQEITIEDLLTMRSGLESTSNRNYGRWVQSSNWVRHALTRPMADEPGGRMIYSTGNSHILSALLTESTGMSTLDFARRYLGEPLGIRLRPWMRDPQGIYFGGNEMHLTPRAMLEVGELYLNRGRVGDRQVISEAWIRESLQPRTQSRWSGHEYGYGWWIRMLAGHRVHYAWGYGGQMIYVGPDLGLTVVMTSDHTQPSGRTGYARELHALLADGIVPAAEVGIAGRNGAFPWSL